jgi:spoIIIJ-associated protein
MARNIETTGRSVAEATTKALRQLGISRNEANVTVIERGSRGFLGLFAASPARVRVEPRGVSDRQSAEAVVGEILRLMHVSSQLHVSEERNSLVVNIETAGADGLLIGKGGHTLAALEYIINRILQRENKKSPRVVLDVSGYKRRREDFLRDKALSLAKQVKSAGKPVTMEPLDAADRKIVHSVLKGDPAVETRSVGHGRTKSIVVAPAGAAKAGAGSPRGARRRRSGAARRA